MLKPLAIWAAFAMAIVSTPATAQKQVSPNHNVGDPNERICEKLTIVGSRLAVKMVCATRAEWAERKREDREITEQAQKGRHCLGYGGPPYMC